MNEKTTLQSAFLEMSLRERIILIVQTLVSVLVLIVAILGLCGIGNEYLMNCIAMALLALLLLVNAVRLFPTRKLSSIIYVLVAVVIAVMLISALI